MGSAECLKSTADDFLEPYRRFGSTFPVVEIREIVSDLILHHPEAVGITNLPKYASEKFPLLDAATVPAGTSVNGAMQLVTQCIIYVRSRCPDVDEFAEPVPYTDATLIAWPSLQKESIDSGT